MKINTGDAFLARTENDNDSFYVFRVILTQEKGGERYHLCVKQHQGEYVVDNFSAIWFDDEGKEFDEYGVVHNAFYFFDRSRAKPVKGVTYFDS